MIPQGYRLPPLTDASQHFQGLRRAQNKSEVNGVGGDSGPRSVDPTLNPITRRPGPGRGRPRKQPAAVAAPSSPASASAGAGTAAAAIAGNPLSSPVPPGGGPVIPPGPGVAVVPIMSGVPGMPGMPAVPGVPGASSIAGTSTVPNPPGPASASPLPDGQVAANGHAGSETPAPPDGSLSGQDVTPVEDDLAVDPDLEDPEEHAAKRARLDDSQDPSLEDVAVLNALAAHNNPPGDVYDQE